MTGLIVPRAPLVSVKWEQDNVFSSLCSWLQREDCDEGSGEQVMNGETIKESECQRRKWEMMEHHCDLEEFNERAFFFFFKRSAAWRGCWFNAAASMDIPPQDLFPAHWAPKCKSPDCLVCMQMYVKCLHCRCIGGDEENACAALTPVRAHTHTHTHTNTNTHFHCLPLLFGLQN